MKLQKPVIKYTILVKEEKKEKKKEKRSSRRNKNNEISDCKTKRERLNFKLTFNV